MAPTFTRRRLEGLFALLPFAQKDNNDVDFEAIREDIEFLKDNGIHGFIAFGCMGQHFAPSEKEFNKVTDVCVDAANGEITCVIGSSAQSTSEAIRRLKYAEDAGADGSMNAPPYALTLDRGMCAKHYELCNDAIKGDLAIMAYNFPPFARGFDMTDNYMWEDYLLKMENLKALKESVSSLPNFHRLLFNIVEKVNVFTGSELTFWSASMLGAKGAIGILAWVAPKHMLKLYEACRKGMWFDPLVLDIYKAMIAPTSYHGEPIGTVGTTWEVALLNALVELGGNKAGPPRPPYRPFPTEWREGLEQNIQRILSIPL